MKEVNSMGRNALKPLQFIELMVTESYNPETYWDEVAKNIETRSDHPIIAGDNEPYYRYKRTRFLALFDTITVENRKVLEIGPGPGGNLLYLSDRGCAELAGADISTTMIELSKKNIGGRNIQLQKIDGTQLPFNTDDFDLVFTSTVLQHITDEIKLRELIKEACRVSRDEIVIFERIEKKIKGHETNIGRPIGYYTGLFTSNGFKLVSTRFLSTRASYYVCGMIRKLFNRPHKKEGEPASRLTSTLQRITLPVTKLLDRILPGHNDQCMLRFKKYYG
jgi:ubiquinone/menaquinone biosynthesis C-methylase UbiE